MAPPLPRRWGVLIAMAILAAGCTTARGSSPKAGGTLRVVAAENMWGSIAAQVGGSAVSVTSIIRQPAVDPHDYEPTPADAREIAAADIVIVNGLGYDAWAEKLADVSPGSRVINIGKLLGLKDGDNPHRWYNPEDVRTFVSELTADFKQIRPSQAARFTSSRSTFEDRDLKTYDSLLAEIRTRYARVPVGASESIFSMLAPALGLDVITPARFLKDVTEGSDVSAADKTTIDRQIAHRLIKLYVYNSQNATPDIQAQLAACRAKGIPTATLTETLAPATATYQQWQVAQLRGIATGLAEGTGR